MIYNSEEIELIKKEVAFNKGEIIDHLDSLLKDTKLDYFEKQELLKLREKAMISDYKNFNQDFNKREIIGYFINPYESSINIGKTDEIHFTYDKKKKKLIVDSLNWEEV